MATADYSNEFIAKNPYKPWYRPWATKPHFIDQRNEFHKHPLFEGRFLAPLLFTLEQSEVRDHCANERTFLSWLRLAVYMAIFAVAIVVNFHIKTQPTPVEKAVSFPLGVVFWVLSAGCLANGIGLYIRTAERYGRRVALVQSGWKVHSVFAALALTIFGTCVFFIVVDAVRA